MGSENKIEHYTRTHQPRLGLANLKRTVVTTMYKHNSNRLSATFILRLSNEACSFPDTFHMVFNKLKTFDCPTILTFYMSSIEGPLVDVVLLLDPVSVDREGLEVIVKDVGPL